MLCKAVYQLTADDKFAKDYGLRDQARKTAVSIMANPGKPCEMAMYYVYVLKSKKDTRLYVGSTKNLRNRLAEHNDGKVKSTCYRVPFELIYYEASKNQLDGLRRERYLKTTYGKRYLKNRLKNDISS